MHHNLAHCRCSGAKFRLEIDVEQIADVTAPTVVLDTDTVRNRERNKIYGMSGAENRLEKRKPERKLPVRLNSSEEKATLFFRVSLLNAIH